MSALAKHLNSEGFIISGSDLSENGTQELKMLGMKIYYTLSAKIVKGADAVVYTSAISLDNPELIFAIKNGIPVIKRSQ